MTLAAFEGVELARNAAEAGAPDWVQLMPPGPVLKGQDGRAWRLDDPDRVVSAFKATGIDLLVDYEHQEDDPARRGNGPVPAAGWIKELRFEPGRGLFGRVEWTATARQLIAGREYRFLSPVFNYDRTGRILRLHGASLVHRPNLTLTALARQETATMPDTPTDTPLARIAAALGLPATADEGAILTALNARQDATPDPARYVPVEAVREMLAERALNRSVVAETEATARVERAIVEGFMPPALRNWGLALCRQDPASFDGFLAGATPVYAHLTGTTPRPALNRQGFTGSASTAEEAAVCAQLGLDPKALG
jgi:phage I-like protein